MADIRRINFDGIQALEIITSAARMVVVTELGPRIAFFGRPGGENLLYWKNDDLGREGWKLKGGHRVWVTRPGADEAEDAYAADNDPCIVDVQHDSVDVRSAVHPVYKTNRGLHIRCISENTFQITSYLINQGPMLYSGGVWSPTCTDPAGGKQYAILLGDRRLTWDLIKLIIPRTFAGHTSQVCDPQISFTEEFLIVNPMGIESKRMVMAPLGIIAMTWPARNLSFVKHVQFNPRGQYPLGCNLAFYVGPDNYMVEMETYGEEQTVLPGSRIENMETWKLLEKTYTWQAPDELRREFGE